MNITCLLPVEILSRILEFLSIRDLVRMESTNKLIQSLCLYEMERQVSRDEWGILIHLGQANATLTHFDQKTKQAHYCICMEPVKIKTMYDHNRPVHLSLLRKAVSNQPYCSQDSFVIQVQKGMIEGEPLLLHVKNQLCQVHAYLTRLPRQHNEPLGPTPLIYTLQITELSIPLSTIAL